MSTSTASTLFTLAAALALGCGGKPSTPIGPGGGGGDGSADDAGGAAAVEIAVAIASVSLAEDCPGERGSLPPPSVTAPGATTGADLAPAKPAADSTRESLREAPGSASMADVCEQSYVQLQVTGKTGTGRFAIRKVELIDDTGKVLGELSARAPTRWQDDHYEPWTEQIEPGSTTSAAYELTAPNWSAYGMSPSDAEGRVFNVRLTVSAGDSERTVEQQATVAATSGPVVLPPGAVT